MEPVQQNTDIVFPDIVLEGDFEGSLNIVRQGANFRLQGRIMPAVFGAHRLRVFQNGVPVWVIDMELTSTVSIIDVVMNEACGDGTPGNLVVLAHTGPLAQPSPAGL